MRIRKNIKNITNVMKKLLKKQKNPTITPFLIVAVTVQSVFGNESILFAVSRNLNLKIVLAN